MSDLSDTEQEAIKERWLPPLTVLNWQCLLAVGWPYLLGLLVLVVFVLVWNRAWPCRSPSANAPRPKPAASAAPCWR